jgi:hypothetical protein
MKSEPEQLAMFKRIADGDHRPNEHGLFDIHQLAHLVSKRDCRVIDAGDISCEILSSRQRFAKHETSRQHIRLPHGNAKIMATDRGLWSPVKIFRACREAAGQPHYEIDYAKAKIKNPGNLNEVLIAEIIGADGVRPYLSRPSRYFTDHADFETNKVNVHELDPVFFTDEDDGIKKGSVGGRTWPMFLVFNQWNLTKGKSYEYRRAVRALDDAGLLKLTLGSRGGFGTATFEWLPLAYLQVTPPELDPVDAEALASLV